MPPPSSPVESHLELLKLYLLEKHSDDLRAILAADDARRHYSVHAGCMSLMDLSVEFGEALISDPLNILSIMDRAAFMALQELYKQSECKEKLSLKDHLHMRLNNLPHFIQTMSLPRCINVRKFQSISGTVLRTTATKVLEHQREYRCNKCGHEFMVEANVQLYHSYPLPSLCPSEAGCNGTRFSPTSKVTNLSYCRDYQEVLVQEKINNLVVGIIPGRMWVILEDDLVDSCKPGQDVLISGVVLVRQRRFSRGQRPDSSFVFQAHSVEVAQAECTSAEVSVDVRKEFEQFWQSHREFPLVGRNKILCSICPQVYGLFLVKLAVALVLAGGVRRTAEDGTKIRGESHLLLVGDPGTAKSQFLKYASKMSGHSVLTTGIGSTSAGLTAAAVKDGSEWQLEAGALVLADGGLCCIDEFNSIREHDRGSIHEAMEQQTLSIAKAGIVSKLSTRCSVLAATNPKGSCSASGELDVNIGIASPLLSRFDLVLVLQDTRNEDWDRLVSTFLLSGDDPLEEYGTDGLWSMNKMRSYFAVIKNLDPLLGDDAKSILQEYYQRQRRALQRSSARTTLRLLESLIRLSQAHARLMFRTEVTTQDAVVAVTLMESSMQRSALLQNLSTLHTSFAKDPELDYKQQAKAILTELGLSKALSKELNHSYMDIPSPPFRSTGRATQPHLSHNAPVGDKNDDSIHSLQFPPERKKNETSVNKKPQEQRLPETNCRSTSKGKFTNKMTSDEEIILRQTRHMCSRGDNPSPMGVSSTHEGPGPIDTQKLLLQKTMPERSDCVASAVKCDEASSETARPENKSAALKDMFKSFSYKRPSLAQHRRCSNPPLPKEMAVSKCVSSDSIVRPVQSDQANAAIPAVKPVCDAVATISKKLSAAEKLKQFRCVPREVSDQDCAPSDSLGKNVQGANAVPCQDASKEALSNARAKDISAADGCVRTSAPTSKRPTLFDITEAVCNEEDFFADWEWEVDFSIPYKRQKTS